MTNEQEREAFEVWARQRSISTQRMSDDTSRYLYIGTDDAWSAWQARAALASQVVQEPVAWRVRAYTGIGWTNWRNDCEALARWLSEKREVQYAYAAPLAAGEPQPMTDENAGERIAQMLMECAERLGNFPLADVDRRAWQHLLTYAPKG